jgi:GTP pyrophosphokinase
MAIVGPRFGEAVALAVQLHADQIRKGTQIPYVAHVIAVAAIVLEHGGDEDQAIAGLLHDVIEDCGAEHEQTINSRFGKRVAAIVRGCTDTDVQPKPPWRARKEAYLAHLAVADADVLLVSAADKLHNARSIVSDARAQGLSVFERFNAGRDGTVWYYTELASVFTARIPGKLANELADSVKQMHSI